MELLRLACNHGNLENLGRQTLSGTYPQKPWGPLPGKREVLLGNLYLGHLTWEPCGILHQGHLYFAWKLETFACKPSLRNLVGTCAGSLPTFTLEPLHFFWLRTLTWKPCGNQDCVTWEPCRNRSFWREPLLGKCVGICIQGKTLSGKPCQKQYRVILGASETWQEPSFGNLYLGIFTWEPFGPSFPGVLHFPLLPHLSVVRR